MSQKVAIIGAGIGGLCLAIYLKHNGIIPIVYESAANIAPVGAGIMMAYNAMQVFEDLDIAHLIEQVGNRINGMEITDHLSKIISSASFKEDNKSSKIYNVAIHRADLQNILMQTLGSQHIQLSKRLRSVDEGEIITLHFEDGSKANCDFLIGADGLNSKVRQYLTPQSKTRYAKQHCWRGICTINDLDIAKDIGVEAWGLGHRFGYTYINTKQIYWYAVSSAHLIGEDYALPEQAFKFNTIAQALIKATPKEKIISSPISDLEPLQKWYKKNIGLIGDAAHATTPNMGQGACQAIEDAYTIGKLLKQGLSLADSFAKMQALRARKVNKIVKQSRMIGQLSHIENKMLAQLRNFVLRLTPKSTAQKQLAFITDLSYIK